LPILIFIKVEIQGLFSKNLAGQGAKFTAQARLSWGKAYTIHLKAEISLLKKT